MASAVSNRDPQAHLTRPTVLLEREPQGAGNWMLDRPARAQRLAHRHRNRQGE